MKKALISPNEEVSYISSWDGPFPIYAYAGKRIAEVSETSFEVAEPLFWVDCSDVVTAESYCYNDTCIEIPPNVPEPEPVQAITSGAQTL